jgi:hypothetical protein
MEFKTGCMLCGRELIYLQHNEPARCVYCGREQETNARCIDGHFVCDACHTLSADDLIEQYCAHTSGTDPLEMAVILMKNPAVKMHGPEHHFLVPAVLLAASSNLSSRDGKLTLIRQARKRAENVLGGFCGFYGACGAAVGTGIFVSVWTGATPLSASEWMLSNRVTAECLMKIAAHGGPRCCKRDTFLALLSASDFVKKRLAIDFHMNRAIRCSFHDLNRECLEESCPFYPR